MIIIMIIKEHLYVGSWRDIFENELKFTKNHIGSSTCICVSEQRSLVNRAIG